MEDKTTCGISVVMKALDMQRKDVLTHIETGKINAVKRGRQVVFEISEKNRLELLHNSYIGFFHLAQKYDYGQSRFVWEKRKCRDAVIEFAVENAWFGADALPITEVFFADTGDEMFFVRKTDEHLFAPSIRLWMASFGESAENKLRLLLVRIKRLYPATGTLLSKFFAEECQRNDCTASWILTDFLCSALNGEITQANDDLLDTLAASADKELPLNSARMFSAFLIYLRSKRKLGNGWAYQFQSRSVKEKSAYPVESYFKMAYIVFNNDAWETERLTEKALDSEAYANLWLFIAFHFICGWRGSDIIRIPMPSLPYDGKTMREQLFAGILNTNSLLEELEFRLRYTPMKPNKTKSYDVPELTLFIAESFREPLAFILAVAASYHENTPPGGAFIRRAGNLVELQRFFGADFVAACGHKCFNTRRANKAYLQGIEMIADNAPGKPKGYMLAALARSHKGGYGALPQTTEIYLRDARFSGYSPEFIAREMFERGVFSFIPALLLDMYKGCQYEKLSVSVQTQLIAEIGISPSGLEELTSSVQYALAKARAAIAEIMGNPLHLRNNVEVILQNIASGNAPGRQDGFLCLMTAAGFGCPNPDRSCCIGCGYEIYTKTILRLLVSECLRLLEKKKAAVKTEADRCEALLKKAVLPAISEIMFSAERLYPNADMKPLLEEVKRRLRSC